MNDIYQKFINSSKSAWAFHKIIFDEKGSPVDYVFIDVNKAFEDLTGLKSEQIIGEKVTTIIPGIEKSEPDLISFYGKVASTGISEQIDFYFDSFKKYYSIIASCPEKGFFITSFDDVTAIKQKEKEFQTVIQSSFDGFWICNLEGKILQVNQSFCKMLGYSEEELLSMNIPDFEVIEKPEETASRIQKIIEKGSDRFETMHRCKNGKILNVQINTTYLPADGGKLYVFNSDITEKKQAEINVQNKINEYYSTLNDAPALIWKAGTDAHCNWFNKEWLEWTGRTMEQEIGNGWAEGVHPDDFDRCLKIYLGAFEKRESFEMEYRLKKANGEYGWILDIGKPVFLNQNVFNGYIGYCFDIDERINTLNALEESKNRLSRAISDSPFPIMIHAEGGEVVQISNSWSEITGYSPEELPTINKWISLAYGMGENEVNKQIQEYYILDKKTSDGEFEVICKNGEKRIWDFSSTPIGKMPDGRKLLMSMANDISDRKISEERVKQSETNLKIILDSMPFGSVIIGSDRKVRAVNRTALQMMGYNSINEVVGATCTQTFCPSCDDKCPVWDLHKKLDKEDKILITNSKTEIPILKSAVEISLDGEKVLLETFIDISNLKKLHIEKEAALRNLGERIKEMQCLFRINEQFRKNDQDIEQIIQNTVNIIPEGWKFPDKTSARILFNGNEVYSAGSIFNSNYFIEEEIIIDNQAKGTIRVNVENNENRSADDIFFPEEKELLKEIAFNFAQFINKIEYDKALKESELKFRNLIENSPMPKVVIDLEGKIEFINKSFLKVIGYLSEDIPKIEDWWPKAYPDKIYRDKVLSKWKNSLAVAFENNEPSEPVEAIIRCKDGKDRNFSVIGNKIGDKILIIFNDITDRLKAEEERDRFFTVSLDLLCIAGTDGYFKRLNPAWHEVLGWSIDELKAKPFLDFVHPDDIAETQKEVGKLTTGVSTISFNNRYRCKDGSYKWLSWNTTPFGDILYAAATDVTDLKNAQLKVADLNERLNLALDGGEVGIWEAILDTGETIWDNRMESMFGLKHNSFDGSYNAFKNCLHPDDVKLTEDAFQMVMDGVKPYDIIYRSRWETGEIRYINAKADVIKDENGNNVKMVGVCIDVTNLKNAEHKILKIADELKRSNHELEQFAYVASHDLQQPLRMVASYTQLLEKRYKDQIDEKANKYIHYAVDGASRMQTLINDLLSYSRITTKGEEFKNCDSLQVVKNSLANLQVLVNETNAKITFGELPEIKGDSSQLERLFQNLIENSIKFTVDKIPEIHISATRKDKKWLFSVKDNGIGIEEKFNEKIFIIFQRLHGREEYPGTGIGLAICKRIVNRHGGDIWFESEKEKGTTFLFTLPVDTYN